MASSNRIWKPSLGMISMDAEAGGGDAATVDALTKTELFKTLQAQVGEDRAIRVLGGLAAPTPDEPATTSDEEGTDGTR
jgi:hypothetical protein